MMRFAEYVKIREEKFGTVIFETLKEKVFVTNETGKEILNLLQQGKSESEVISILEDTYVTKGATIKKDVVDFIAQLKEKGIIN